MASQERILALKRSGTYLVLFLCVSLSVVCWKNQGSRIQESASLVVPLRRSLASATSDVSSVDTVPGPILVMGLPRSGSISFHNFFQCNGIKSAHYCCGNSPKSSFSCGGADHPTCGSCVLQNLQQSRPAFYNCSGSSHDDNDYQVYSQFDVEATDPFEWFLPQHFALPLLHAGYPEATWILNRRDSAALWADSVLHWYSVSVRIMSAFGMSYHTYSRESTATETFPLIGPQVDVTEADVQGCLQDAYDTAVSQDEYDRRRTDLMTIYNLHLTKIRKFVTDHPSHRLIEINVDDASAGDVLVKEFAAAGYKPKCWNFEAQDYDGDWKDFTLKV